jgi:hypothetical protein
MADKMTDADLIRYINQEESSSIHSDGTINAEHSNIFNRYTMEPWLEVEDESKVQSSDIFDVVQADMTSMVKVFLGNDAPVEFSPINKSEKEAREAEEKNSYIDFLVRNQQDSYKTRYDWMLGAELYRYSAVHFGYQEEDTVRVVEYSGLSDDDFAEINIMLSIEESEGAEVDVTENGSDESGSSIKATISKTVGSYFVEYIDPEYFWISRGATNVNDAVLSGHDKYVRKSDLIQMGYDEEVVKSLDVIGYNHDTKSNDKSSKIGSGDKSNALDWTGELVKLETRFVKVDQDGDGISERVKVLRVGDEILESSPHEIAPYAVLCSVPMPGQIVGSSRAIITEEIQNIRTMMWRHIMNNSRQVGTGRVAVNKNVELDDLTVNREEGVVRIKGEGSPLESVAPLPIPFVGDKLTMVMQLADSARAQRTGSLLASQSLESDQLNKETATRFKGVNQSSNSKVAMVARGYAETGIKELYAGMLWTVLHFQKSKTEVMVLGKEITVDPRKWNSPQLLYSNVSLSLGEDDKTIEELASIYNIHEALAARGSPLTDSKKQYNVLSKIVKAMDKYSGEDLFNNPDIPEELMLGA